MEEKYQLRPKVVVVGTYHMGPTGDFVKNVNGEDILHPNKQKEINELIDRLKTFKPTKVAVEIEKKENDALNTDYQGYLNSSFTLSINEVHQIAFRLAKAMNHKEIFAIDWMENIGQRHFGDVMEWAEIQQPDIHRLLMEDYLPLVQPNFFTTNEDTSILDKFKELNDPKYVKVTHEFYMHVARLADGGNYVGIDWLRWWYQRNLITYSNLTKLVEDKNDRIFLLIGSSHVYLVNQFLRESNMFDVENANDYLL